MAKPCTSHRRPQNWLARAALSTMSAAIVAAGCDPPPTSIPPGPSPVLGQPVAERPYPPPAPVLVDSADAGPTAGTPSPPPGTGAGLVRDGGACQRAQECASGICEGQGCGPDRAGACMSRNRSCTRDLRVYCGCDGATFQASGTCPGRRYRSRSPCKS